MERYFGIMYVLLLIPILFCQNKTGPLESSLTARAINSIGTAKTTIPQADRTISINRLKNF
jgi:hypothetical protein